jgi:hypothetical protein
MSEDAGIEPRTVKKIYFPSCIHILHMQGWWKLKHPEEAPAVQLQRPRVQRRLTVSQLIASARSSITAQPRESPHLSLSSGNQTSETASPDMAVSGSYLPAAPSLSSEDPLSRVLPRVGEHTFSSPSVLCNHRKRCHTNGSGSTLGKFIYTRYPHIWCKNIFEHSVSYHHPPAVKFAKIWTLLQLLKNLQSLPTYLMYECFIIEKGVFLRLKIKNFRGLNELNKWNVFIREKAWIRGIWNHCSLWNSVPDLDPYDPYVFGPLGSESVIICTDPNPALDPDHSSFNRQKIWINHDFYCFETSQWHFIFEDWC